jgi:hypothetical protein
MKSLLTALLLAPLAKKGRAGGAEKAGGNP